MRNPYKTCRKRKTKSLSENKKRRCTLRITLNLENPQTELERWYVGCIAEFKFNSTR